MKKSQKLMVLYMSLLIYWDQLGHQLKHYQHGGSINEETLFRHLPTARISR